MPQLHLLRVFCDDDGTGGNPLGVFLDGPEVSPERRQAVAADLGLSEIVFVDDADVRKRRAVPGAQRRHPVEVRIFTPTVELDFAGHPAVGTAWLLDGVEALRAPAGELAVTREGDAVLVAARPEWGPPWELAQLGSPGEVEALDGPPDGHDLTAAWAWIDEGAGTIRARAFPIRIGIAEDEATGSAATKLCALLGRAIDIRQGRGSRILARPSTNGFVEIGGRSVVDEVRDYTLP
jgi:predicted PhzF superfamily epimerase YddE/YHI9